MWIVTDRQETAIDPDAWLQAWADLQAPAQREAVRELLLLPLSDAHWEFVHPMIEAALSEFWTARKES